MQNTFEKQNYHPQPHYRAPCMKYFEVSIRPLYTYRCAPENTSYLGRDSGGGWGNSGSPSPNSNLSAKRKDPFYTDPYYIP